MWSVQERLICMREAMCKRGRSSKRGQSVQERPICAREADVLISQIGLSRFSMRSITSNQSWPLSHRSDSLTWFHASLASLTPPITPLSLRASLADFTASLASLAQERCDSGLSHCAREADLWLLVIDLWLDERDHMSKWERPNYKRVRIGLSHLPERPICAREANLCKRGQFSSHLIGWERSAREAEVWFVEILTNF